LVGGSALSGRDLHNNQSPPNEWPTSPLKIPETP
jgi:hypothetical protein